MKKTIRYLVIIQVFFLFHLTSSVFEPAVGAERVEIGRFSDQDIQNWKMRKFQFETLYSLESFEGKFVLKAESDISASAIYKDMQIDLTRTPYLNWSWRVENTLPGLDERTKKGDDFPARVFLIIKSGIKGLKSKALNYVWSSTTPQGESWSSPYSTNVKMVALRSGNTELGTWVNEKRNVKKDLKKYFGIDFSSIDSVAVMTDTDNSGKKALTYYGDIYFTDK